MLVSPEFNFLQRSSFFGVPCRGDLVILEEFVSLIDPRRSALILRLFAKKILHYSGFETCIAKRYELFDILNFLIARDFLDVIFASGNDVIKEFRNRAIDDVVRMFSDGDMQVRVDCECFLSVCLLL